MNLVLAIFIGGGIGSVVRHYFIDALNGNFPYGTLLVNVLGSFIMGALIEAFALKFQAPQEVRAFLFTGFLGGFTTFSTFSADVLRLAEADRYLTALSYAGVSVGLSLAAAFAAVFIVRGIF